MKKKLLWLLLVLQVIFFPALGFGAGRRDSAQTGAGYLCRR